ncbi:hypothetical protein [Actinomadura madurae]|uniref:hypothetical protein n=1 Tax=Actinomadura madurae TaxID=1993 RepID=UPI0011608611|nr:hypothetical protein [Actinomadura madurae]
MNQKQIAGDNSVTIQAGGGVHFHDASYDEAQKHRRGGCKDCDPWHYLATIDWIVEFVKGTPQNWTFKFTPKEMISNLEKLAAIVGRWHDFKKDPKDVAFLENFDAECLIDQVVNLYHANLPFEVAAVVVVDVQVRQVETFGWLRFPTITTMQRGFFDGEEDLELLLIKGPSKEFIKPLFGMSSFFPYSSLD